MRQLILSGLLLSFLILASCSGATESPVLTAPVDDPAPRQTVGECPPPGPAPGAPIRASQGELYARHRNAAVGTFLLTEGPFLRKDDNGCEHWAFGAYLTVNFSNGHSRLYWSDHGSNTGHRFFVEEPSNVCPHPTGEFILGPISSHTKLGHWMMRDRGCHGEGRPQRHRGTYKFVPFGP